MASGAEFPPVVVFHDGVDHWVADGFHRVHAARRLGLAEVVADIRTGTCRDAVFFSVGANLTHGLRRSNADKRRAVETILRDREWARWSDAEIGRICGVSQPFVGHVRSSLITVLSDKNLTRRVRTKHGTETDMEIGAIGAGRGPRYVTEHSQERDDIDQSQQVRDQEPSIQLREDVETEPLRSGAPLNTDEPQRDRGRLAVHFSSETPEHYTPRLIIDAALEVMGEIDLDPCSNSRTVPNVPARSHFTKDDDGLSRPWHGRVYMNPPYGREIEAWVRKLVDEHRNGGVTEAIALLPGRIDTQWLRLLRDFVRCEVEGRLTFIGNNDPAPFPSVVYYLGNDIGVFYRAFQAIGDIWQRVEPEMFGE